MTGRHKISKIQVSNGVWWVEIPDVDLRLLCGCPADSVKNLRRRGLIVTQEEDGITFETGPNAILLSDVATQNGSFANLAEFPVLQMLYRQGMILPGHPNNTGAKPLLIGLDEVVRAQADYIRRGNYGLVSRDEIRETGVGAADAEEMMRLKLRFAFGSIKETEELLDLRTVRKEVVDLGNDVFLRRLGLNRYELMWQDESVDIDLRLAPDQSYESSYVHGMYDVPRQYFSVVHMGEGDGWDMNRPCMGSMLTYQGRVYLIDAGPNLLRSLTALGVGVNEVAGVFHTHCHDDHFAGLTTLLRADHRIPYLATPLVRASVMKKLSALLTVEESELQRYFEFVDLRFDEWNDIDGLEVKPVFSAHPVETSVLFFRARWYDTCRSYAHLADIARWEVLESMMDAESFESMTQALLEPADIKKIDIGGGMIHGCAGDFADDKSGKILLSHTERELTPEEREIGSSASFGMQDVLIPSAQDVFAYTAFGYLQAYFPNVPFHDLRELLNYPIDLHNAGTIVLPKGAATDAVYLVLNGVLELIDPEGGRVHTLAAGCIVGEHGVLGDGVSSATYRAVSYVRALRIPRDVYISFLRRNGLYEDMQLLLDNRRFLQSTSLFGEMVSYSTQNMIARRMSRHSYAPGDPLGLEDGNDLVIVETGGVNLRSAGRMEEHVAPGGFFEVDGLFEALASAEGAEIVCVAGEALEDVPVVRWKLLECHNRRMRAFGTRFSFEWRPDYAVGIEEFDRQHRRFFEMGAQLLAAHEAGSPAVFASVLEELDRILREHFQSEERCMEEHGYSEYAQHKVEHDGLLEEAEGFRAPVDGRSPEREEQIIEFLKTWLIRHTLMRDRRYRDHLRGCGVG